MSTALATIDPAAGNVPAVSFEQLEKMALAVSKSGLFACRTPEQAMTLMLLCQAEGLHPIQALRQYHIIDGRPSMRADAMQGRFQQAGGKVRWLKRTDAEVSAEFSHPDLQPEPITVTWDNEKVRKAGLDRGNHQKYPLAMKSARVISEGVRAIMPGVVVGLYTPEEVQDFDGPPAPAAPRTPKKVPSVTVSRTDEGAREEVGESQPEGGAGPLVAPELANDQRFELVAKSAAMARGITPDEFDANFPGLLTKLGGVDKMPVGVREKVIADIKSGKADKWKQPTPAPQQQPAVDDAAQPAAPDELDVPQRREPPPFSAGELALRSEKELLQILWLAADDKDVTEIQVKTLLNHFAHAKKKSTKGLNGDDRLELFRAIEAKAVDWNEGAVREAAAV